MHPDWTSAKNDRKNTKIPPDPKKGKDYRKGAKFVSVTFSSRPWRNLPPTWAIHMADCRPAHNTLIHMDFLYGFLYEGPRSMWIGVLWAGLRVAMWITHVGGRFRHGLLEKSRIVIFEESSHLFCNLCLFWGGGQGTGFWYIFFGFLLGDFRSDSGGILYLVRGGGNPNWRVKTLCPVSSCRPDKQAQNDWLLPETVLWGESLPLGWVGAERLAASLQPPTNGPPFPEGPNLEKNQSRLNAWKLQAFAWNFQSRLNYFQSRLKISIRTLRIPHKK